MEGGQHQIQIGEDVVTLQVSPWRLAHEPVEVDVHLSPKLRLSLPMADASPGARCSLYPVKDNIADSGEQTRQARHSPQ
jgi:hypothetical protein